jgi:integrase
MKRNRLYPGINRVKVRLSDGASETYIYAGKGGPRVFGKEGSAEFNKNWLEAMAARHDRTRAPSAQLLSVIRKYQQSDEFKALSPRTQSDYAYWLAREVEAKWGDFPIAGLTDPRVRELIFDWRSELAKTSAKRADNAVGVLRTVLSWGVEHRLVTTNPATKIASLYTGSRVDKIWSDADEALILAHASQCVSEVIVAAADTGQRKGDLLRLTWPAYDGTHIRLQQSKRGRRVIIRVTQRLKAILDAKSRHSPFAFIFTNSEGHPWKEASFDTLWRRARIAAGIAGLTFNDLRGTAVTRLALAGCSIPEIASITGHSLKDVSTILDKHYLHRDQKLSDGAIAKLEAWRREQNAADTFPNEFPNEPEAPSADPEKSSIDQSVPKLARRPVKRMHDPSASHSRARLGCRAGTFSPSRRQIRSTRLSLTSQPPRRSSSAILR